MEKVGQNIIRSFIKIGQKEHIDQLWKKGVVFMNPINFFIQMDDDEQRKDVYEGIERMEQITKIEFKWDNKSIKLDKDSEQNKLINAQLRVHNPELRGNIFSMIGITSELSSKTDKIDSRNANFGDSFLLILNPSEFLNRFDKAIKEMGLSYDWDIVKYYDERVFEGVLDIFCKSRRFEHQNEFRILVEKDHDEPLIIEIGGIQDISKVFSIDYLEKLRFREEIREYNNNGG